MKIEVVVHEAEEGGYWAEVPSIPGCATQGDSYEELLANVHEAVEGCLSVDVSERRRLRDGQDHRDHGPATASQRAISQPWNTTARPVNRASGYCRARRSSAR